MSAPPSTDEALTPRLVTARVLRVEEHSAEVVGDDGVSVVPFAPTFPSPRRERVSPGHLVAVATGPRGARAVVWRWYDAVVLGPAGAGSVRLWEPAHGEVVAQTRAHYLEQVPGSRAYASAGLPGAEWWVAGSAERPPAAQVELDEVDALYTEHGMWASVFTDDG